VGPNNGGELGAVDRLAVEQKLNYPIKSFAMVAEQLPRPDLSVAQQSRHLLVEGRCVSSA
jgi:hypothetical protein